MPHTLTSPYASHDNAHAELTVVKIGGALLDSADAFKSTFTAILALDREIRARGGRGAVLVHGGGAAVDRQFTRLGLESEKRQGIRITPPEHIDDLVSVLAGSVHQRLLGLLHALGARAVGLSLGDGGLCRCQVTTRFAFDAGLVGEIIDGDAAILDTLLRDGFLPVLNSIGMTQDGTPLNVNADDAASAIARIACATELLLLTDVAGVLNASNAVIAELDAAGIDALIADGTVSGGMTAKVRAAQEAAVAAGCPVRIASWREQGSLSGNAGTRILSRAALLA
ncbi:MAG: acetylglutamate kinase [Phycisphaerales bacterium]|nr:acetylglutamate kinase [Phycisphaerales bacterium]